LSAGRKLAPGISHARLVVIESASRPPLPPDRCWPMFIGEVQQFPRD
jgi:hypothetical protein